MVIIIENNETADKLINLSRLKHTKAIGQLAKGYLRQEFENANTSPTVMALIEQAEYLGLQDLAIEFKASLTPPTGNQ